MTEQDVLREQVARKLWEIEIDEVSESWGDLDEVWQGVRNSNVVDGAGEMGGWEADADAILSVVNPVLEGLRDERDSERESRIAWALEADRLQQIALQAVAKLEKLRDEQLDRDPGHECDCEDTGECHAVAAHWAYLRALTAVRPATRPASDVPGLNPDCTADEAACVHGQTADLTGLAAREDTR